MESKIQNLYFRKPVIKTICDFLNPATLCKFEQCDRGALHAVRSTYLEIQANIKLVIGEFNDNFDEMLSYINWISNRIKLTYKPVSFSCILDTFHMREELLTTGTVNFLSVFTRLITEVTAHSSNLRKVDFSFMSQHADEFSEAVAFMTVPLLAKLG